MSKPGIALTILVVLLLVVGLAVGGWQLGWWLREESVQRSAEIRQTTFGRQNALVEQILDDIREAQQANIPDAQRIAVVNIICDSAAKLTGSIELPAHANEFIQQECP